MFVFLSILIWIVIGILFVYYINNRRGRQVEEKYQETPKEVYLPYKVKQTIMSPKERLLFENLRSVLNTRYDVYPQVHLDIIFGVEYQRVYKYYLGYLRKINQKSVDYLIVDRNTQSPVFAIELDDITHEQEDRRERDAFVQTLFDKTRLNLVRFNSGQYQVEELRRVLGKYLV